MCSMIQKELKIFIMTTLNNLLVNNYCLLVVEMRTKRKNLEKKLKVALKLDSH
jgi:hypothetical protein